MTSSCCSGDPSAIERISHEFCEDEARNGVAYVEARFSPHLMSTKDGCAPEEVVRAVLRGFHRGEQDFGVKVMMGEDSYATTIPIILTILINGSS